MKCIALSVLTLGLSGLAVASPSAGVFCNTDVADKNNPRSVSFYELGDRILIHVEGDFERFQNELKATSLGTKLPAGRITRLTMAFSQGCHPSKNGGDLPLLRMGCLDQSPVDLTLTQPDGSQTSHRLMPKFTIFRTALHDVLSWSGPQIRFLVAEVKVGDPEGQEALLSGQLLNPQSAGTSWGTFRDR